MINPINRSRALLALALSAALASTVAIAQQATPAATPEAMHQRLDANGDGAIDKAEAAKAPRLAQQFDQLDKNHDGRLGADERPQMRHGDHDGHDGMHDRMMQFDTDKDGRISSKEAAAKPELAQKFADFDANHDGFLDRSDFQARMRQKHDACFANADADKDGKLSRDEFDAARQQCQHDGGMRGHRRGGDATQPAGG
jgi:Ca2+-binding EF-hand superfamily protein